jgi:hypothetical protein
VVHDRIFVATLHACHLFVPQTHWREALFDGGVFKGDAPLLAEVFGSLHRAGIQTGNLSILGLIEHGHLCPASPTPEYLHASILIFSAGTDLAASSVSKTGLSVCMARHLVASEK